MPKIAFVSDLHLACWDHYKDLVDSPLEVIKESIQEEKPDLILDAGDYEKDYHIEGYDEGGPKEIVKIQGNHDFYGKTWQDHFWSLSIKHVKSYGLNIGMCTFWVDFNQHNLELMRVYEACLADCNYIKNFTAEHAYQCHKRHRDWLYKESKIQKWDIIVTHHTPTFQAVHPRFLRDNFDRQVSHGFSSHLEQMVIDLEPKIWAFGHTHDSYDFEIGRTRMLCNPCGYPSERGYRERYKPVYVEI